MTFGMNDHELQYRIIVNNRRWLKGILKPFADNCKMILSSKLHTEVSDLERTITNSSLSDRFLRLMVCRPSVYRIIYFEPGYCYFAFNASIFLWLLNCGPIRGVVVIGPII